MMNLDRKSFLDAGGAAPSSARQLKVLLINGEQSAAVEFQASVAQLPGVVVEVLPTLARLSLALQKGASRPDLIAVDMSPDDADDLALLRDLRKVQGLEDVPVVALTDRKAVHVPLRAIRAGANDVLFKPVDPGEAREVFARVMDLQKLSRPSAAPVGKAVVFMHLSGGAGATTLAVNAACALARTPRPKQTCLVDLDLQFGNAASLLDLPSTSPVQEFIDEPARLDESMLESMMLRHQTGLQVLTAPRTLLPLSAYGPEGIRNLVDVAKRNFEYVIVDLPVVLAPWTDSVLRSASVVYLVTSISVPSAHRLIKFFELLHEEGVRNLPMRLVANRHHRANRRGNDISVAQFEKATWRKVDYMIPNDYSLISLSHGQGKPAVRLKPNSPFSVALTDMLAAELGREALSQPKRSLFSFGRT
jgi:pilus assembly protein CpaE